MAKGFLLPFLGRGRDVRFVIQLCSYMITTPSRGRDPKKGAEDPHRTGAFPRGGKKKHFYFIFGRFVARGVQKHRFIKNAKQ
jgi:hypothetical protein